MRAKSKKKLERLGIDPDSIRPTGRPEKPIDWELVDKFLEAGCNGVQISSHFGMHPHTFYDRVVEKYAMTYTDYAALHTPKGEAHLLLSQHQKSLNSQAKGNAQMLIWLGKVRLGQREPEPIKEKPPNDDKLDNLITQAKAPENIVSVENSNDGTQSETIDELPTS